MINKTSAVLLAIVMVMTAGLCLAGDGWQSSLVVSSGNASSRLTFGQNPAATDRQDGFYDVPALFSGALQAAFSDGGEDLWRDIRSAGLEPEQEWRLNVNSETGEATKVSWDKKSLPENLKVVLIDVEAGMTIDMKEFSSDAMEDGAGGELLIKVGNI